MAQIVYTANPPEGAPIGSLFSGKKLFLTQKTPSRSHFIELIKANGGEVVKLEKSADLVIADDARKEVVPGSYSYKWIDNSIKKGALQDLDDYLAGPPVGVPRPVGSIIRPAKNTRNGYTAEDDRVLLEWLQTQTRKGASISGNETYKQLEAQNPRHTWQSWRDRWVKTLRLRHPLPLTTHEAPLTPGDGNSTKSRTAPRSRAKKPETPKPAEQKPLDIFTDEDINTLRVLTPALLDILPEREDEAWNEWARHHPKYSAERWRTFWQKNILPIARHSSGEIIIKEEESPSRKSTPATSPTFHTQSPHVAEITPSTTDRDKARKNIKLNSPWKRKRAAEEDESSIPSSPPIVPNGSYSMAYSPCRKKLLQSHEVPSTPDSELRIGNQPSSSQKVPFVKDTLEEVEQHSIETDDFLGNGREVTPSLSEPQARAEDFVTRRLDPTLTKADANTSEDESTIAQSQQQMPRDVLRNHSGTPSPGGDVTGDDDGSATEITYPILPQVNETATQDTQALLREEVPAFDLDVPEPEDGWQAYQSPPPPMPSSSNRSKGKGKERAQEEPRLQGPTPSNDEEGLLELSAWITKQLARGYPMTQIQTAMMATSMDFDLAMSALRCLRKTGRIPTHAPGIWTPADDAKLAAVDAREIRALQEKHGNESLDQRIVFLKTYRDVQQSDRAHGSKAWE